MPTTLEFLQAVLPTSGLYCYTIILNKQARNYFTDNLEDLSNKIQYCDKRYEGTDGAVYHGCATYNPGGRKRTQSETWRIRSLWLDIDTGDGKPYSSLQPAIEHLQQFIQHYRLPIPILVCSGNGLHVYWPLEKDLSREQWQPIAQALKQACHMFGLGAGPERTADSASILRPPGTTHRKGAPRPVVCGPLMPPSPLEAFHELGVVRTGSRRIPNSLNASRSLLKDCANVYSPEAIDFDALCEGCFQFRTFRDNNSTYGPILEPLFYALLGVLGWAYNGERKAHEWASKHPNYDYNYTQKRLERVKELSGPTTCAHIKSLNPKGCEGCLFGTSTPLEAGRRKVDALASSTLSTINEGGSESEASSSVDGSLEGNAIEGRQEYFFKKGELYFRTQSNQSAPIEVKLSSFPVRISSIHIGEINKDQYYYLFQHYKPHNGWHDVVVKPSDVHGASMLSTLANMGIVVHDPTKFHAYIKDSVDSINGRKRAEMSYEQFGWKDGGFLLGNRLYCPGGWEPAALSPSLRLRAQWLKPTEGGSVEGWKQAVDNLMGSGSEGMSLTVLASFASVLMPFFDTSEGGAVINLMTRHSGAGKTTSLSGALTVWSADPRALELINIDTKVSKASSLGALCNLPCLYDEFSTKDPDITRDFMEMFTSGRDKYRGDGTGGVHINPASWRMLLIAANNTSIQETIISQDKSGAPALRVLELPVESDGNLKPSELLNISKQLRANAGWAGEAYIAYLVQPGVKEWITDKLKSLLDEITEECGFRKEHRFWARALAAIGCAALIVDELSLVSFSPNRIMEWAINHFKEEAKGLKAEPKSLLEYLAAYLNEKVGETLIMPGPYEKFTTHIGDKPKNRVSIRIEVKNKTCYVEEAPFRKWLGTNAGGGYKDLIKELQYNHMLLSDKRLKVLTAGTDIEGGQVRCLVFEMDHPIFSGKIREVKEELRTARENTYEARRDRIMRLGK